MWKVFWMQMLYSSIWYENVESVLCADFVWFYLVCKCGKCSQCRLSMVVLCGMKMWKCSVCRPCMVLFGMKMWKAFCMQTLYGCSWHKTVENVLYADFVCLLYLAWKHGKCSVGLKTWKVFRLQTLNGSSIWHENMECVMYTDCIVGLSGMKAWKVFCLQTLYSCSIWHENEESVLSADSVWLFYLAWKWGKRSVCRLCMVVLFGMKMRKAFCLQTLYGCSIWHENEESVVSADSVWLFYLAWKWGKCSVCRLCMVVLFGMNKQKQVETCSGCRLRMAVLLVMKMWKVFCVQTLYQVQGTVNRHQAQERVNRHHSREAVNDATVMLFPSPFVKSLQSGLYHWNSKHITHYHQVCSLVFTTETANTSHIITKSAVWSLPRKQQTHHTLSPSLQSGLYHWNSKYPACLSLHLQSDSKHVYCWLSSGVYQWNSKRVTYLFVSLYHWNSKHIICLSLSLVFTTETANASHVHH